ncbi:MAG TPA: MATE family efflux transporter [Cytophagales bacterium]|nr:MATE family efflux transporter [Cytophagales bacterium]
MAGIFLYGLNTFMDTVYVGQLLNETALAGVALAYPLASILMGFGAWAGTGAANLLSIALGNNDEDTQQKLLPNATLFGFVSTLAFAIPANAFAPVLIQLMGGEGGILIEGVTYLRTSLLMAPFWVYGVTFNMIIRGEGKMKTAAGIMAAGLLPNLALTPLFILVFDMGVAGAAWATNLGMLLYSLFGYLYFVQKRASFAARVNSLRYHRATFWAIAQSGFPGFMVNITSLIQAVVVLNTIVYVGVASDLAFYAAANRMFIFLVTPMFGLMRALQPIVGINYGAEQYDRVKKSFQLFSFVGLLLVAPFWLGMSWLPEASLRLVLPDYLFVGQEAFYLRVYLAVLPLLPIVFMALTFFPAIGKAKQASLVGVARQLFFFVPAMILLPRYFGLGWVYYGATLIDIFITGWVALLVVKEFRILTSKTHELEN